MAGLSINNTLQRKFQRPMTKRRSYDTNANVALKTCSLGQKRRLDGMAKLMARAGKGLMYKLPQTQKKDGECSGTSDESDSEEEEKEPERPFEPLCVWKSPHDGGEAKGLPPRLYVFGWFGSLFLVCGSLLYYQLLTFIMFIVFHFYTD